MLKDIFVTTYHQTHTVIVLKLNNKETRQN